MNFPSVRFYTVFPEHYFLFSASSRASDISGDGLSRSMYFHPTDKPPVYEENVKHRNHRPSG